jgi:hypothetical protein
MIDSCKYNASNERRTLRGRDNPDGSVTLEWTDHFTGVVTCGTISIDDQGRVHYEEKTV